MVVDKEKGPKDESITVDGQRGLFATRTGKKYGFKPVIFARVGVNSRFFGQIFFSDFFYL